MTHSLSALEVDHILQNKKCEFLGALTDVLDSEQYDIVVGVLEDALSKMVDELFELDNDRLVGVPDKILCFSCKNLVRPNIKRLNENGDLHEIRIFSIDCSRCGILEPCRVDCHRYEPKP